MIAIEIILICFAGLPMWQAIHELSHAACAFPLGLKPVEVRLGFTWEGGDVWPLSEQMSTGIVWPGIDWESDDVDWRVLVTSLAPRVPNLIAIGAAPWMPDWRTGLLVGLGAVDLLWGTLTNRLDMRNVKDVVGARLAQAIRFSILGAAIAAFVVSMRWRMPL